MRTAAGFLFFPPGVEPLRWAVMNYKLAGALVLLSLALLFALQNATVVRVRLLFWGVECPLALLVVVLLLIGLVGGWSLGTWRSRSR